MPSRRLRGVHLQGRQCQAQLLDIEACITFFDLFDYLTSNIMLPVTGLLTALFVGWVVPEAVSLEELQMLREHHWFRGWMIMMRYGVSAVLFVVFYNLVF